MCYQRGSLFIINKKFGRQVDKPWIVLIVLKKDQSLQNVPLVLMHDLAFGNKVQLAHQLLESDSRTLRIISKHKGTELIPVCIHFA